MVALLESVFINSSVVTLSPGEGSQRGCMSQRTESSLRQAQGKLVQTDSHTPQSFIGSLLIKRIETSLHSICFFHVIASAAKQSPAPVWGDCFGTPKLQSLCFS